MWITVVICTWNRAKLLRAVLASIDRVHPPPAEGWDVLVVDNNSTDDTADVVEEFRRRLPVSRVVETQQGLSSARNRACRVARGDYLIFTDDDVIVDARLLAEYARAFAAHPAASFFGGTIEPTFLAKPPRWLAKNFNRFASAYALRSGRPGMEALTTADFLPYGANMAFSREVLQDAPFSTRLGRRGAELIGGEETEFMARLLASGRQGVWVGPAKVEHVIGQDRMTKTYIWNYFFCQGIVQVRQEKCSPSDVDWNEMRKKLRRRRRELLFTLSRNQVWAKKFVWCAVAAGRIQELDAATRAYQAAASCSGMIKKRPRS